MLMTNNCFRRLAYPLALILAGLVLTHAGGSAAYAKDNWTSVRSKNFFLIGNATDKEIRQVATRLEQFRDAFSRLFMKAQISSPVPTTVIVFKSDSTYKPFKPGANVAGYFQAGEDVNYITLTTELLGDNEDPFRIIFHEYVHLLVNNTFGNPPAWFNEGLAEYYSTFNITDDRKVMLGKVILNHVLFLREQKLLPLRTLFAVDHSSPYYNEKNKANVFYAQSWALVHYLILGNKGQRLKQMGQFVDLLNAGKPVEAAFNEAFQTTYEALEKELREYIRRDTYPAQIATFERKLEFENEMQSAPITEAAAQAYLGDLLFHSNRAEAEGYLQKALSLDANLGIANASMGLLRARQGKFDQAREYLEKAVSANTQNYLAHYYYAFALSRQGMDANNIVYRYAPEALQTMRAELKKAIDLAPSFAESYHLLAFINLVAGEQLDESIVLLKRALALSPGKLEYAFMLAQLYSRKEDFVQAKQILQPIARDSAEPQIRQSAQVLLDQIISFEERKARFDATRNSPPVATGNSKHESAVEETPQVSIDPSSYLAEALRKPLAGEVRAQGILARIDCGTKGIVLTIKSADRLLKVQTATFQHMEMSTYTPNVSGEITCGVRKHEDAVIVTYKPTRGARASVDGTATALEFVPKDFKLKQ